MTCVDPATTWRPAVQALGFEYQQGSHDDPEVIKLAQARRPSYVQNDAQCSERTTRLTDSSQARDSSAVGPLHCLQGADIVICSHVAVDFIKDDRRYYFAQVLASPPSGWKAQADMAAAGKFPPRLIICQDRYPDWDEMAELLQDFCTLVRSTSIVNAKGGTCDLSVTSCAETLSTVPRQLIITRQTPLQGCN